MKYFASNKYLAEKLDVNPKTISSWISDLRDKNFIIVEQIRNENKQILKEMIKLIDKKLDLDIWQEVNHRKLNKRADK